MKKKKHVNGFVGRGIDGLKGIFNFKDGIATIPMTPILEDGEGEGETEIVEFHYLLDEPPKSGKPYEHIVTFEREDKLDDPKGAAEAVKNAFDSLKTTGEDEPAAEQAILLPVWDKYDLWQTLVLVHKKTIRTKRKKEIAKTKPMQIDTDKLVRVGSCFADALINSASEETGDGLSIQAKRVLLELVKYIPSKEETDSQLYLFEEMKGGHISITRPTLKKIASSVFGQGGTREMWQTVKVLQEAAKTVKTFVKLVDVENTVNKEGKPRRCVTYETLTGSFISLGQKWREITEEDMTIKLPPDHIEVGLHQMFGYWVKHYYDTVEMPKLIERSRGKDGEEYMALRLWGIDQAPCVKAAQKNGKAHSAVFEFVQLPGWKEAEKSQRQRIRDRCTEVANEACQDMGANQWHIVTRSVMGGHEFIGIQFDWLPKQN